MSPEGTSVRPRLAAAVTIALASSLLPAQDLSPRAGPQFAATPAPESALSEALGRTSASPSRYAVKDGRWRAAAIGRSRSYAGGPANAAVEYLREHALSDTSDGRFIPVVYQTRELGANTAVKVRLEADGIPIRGAGSSFLISPANEVLAFQGYSDAQVQVNQNWRITADAAQAVASRRYPSHQPEIPVERIYLLRDGRAEPFWDATVITPQLGEWSVLISAVTGAIEETSSLRWGQAQGYAFGANPIKGQVSQVQLENLTSTSSLTGTNAKIYSYLPNLLFLEQPRIFLQVAQPVAGNYLYSPNDRRFSEVQLYHGMDRAASRFRALGFPGFDRPLEGVVLYKDFIQGQGVFAGQNNAYFSPVEFSNRGGLFFYLTPRNLDTSWDSDVIFHEYTHAVVNFAVGRNQSRTFRAINEGTADYFAASFLDDPAVAEWAAEIFGERLPFLRSVDNTNRWPSHLVGEEHVDGNIWSGALWDLRKALGAERTDRIVLGSLALMDGSEEFFDAAVAVAAAAQVLYDESTANTAIDVLVNRGVGSNDAATASRAATLRSGAGAQGSIPAAGTSQLLGAQQYRIDVPNQASGLRVQVTASGNVRFFIRYRAPITVQNGQLVFEQFTSTPATSLSGTLSLSNTPELQSGTYYIAVTNTTTAPVTYTLTATVTGGSVEADPATTVLTNGERSSGSAPAGPFLASRQFAIDVPAGTTGLTVSLTGNRDVDLYVRRGIPVFLNSQGFPEADFESDSAESNETLAITTRSLPLPLLPGRYYIGVLNYSGETATYSVTATLSSAAVPSTQTQALSPDTSVIINAPQFVQSGWLGSLVPQQVSIAVPADAVSLKISPSTQLDIDLIVRRGSAYVPGGLADHIHTPSDSQPDLEITSDSSPRLQAGSTYFVAIANYSANGGPITLRYTITRRQAGAGQISAAGIVSAASFQGGGVAPGEIITLFGSGIGPPALTGLQLVGSRVATQLAQTRVLFDNVAAPLIYVSAGQISCVVPYSVSGKTSVTVLVEYQGLGSNSVTVPVQSTRPALFTANSSGAGAAALLNQDNSVNTVANPADRGSVVVLYATGEGVTNPTGVDGQIAQTVFPRPIADLGVTIGGQPAEILYAGAAPGLVAGVLQVNARIPSGISAGSSVPVQLRVGGATSRTGVTLSVR